VSLWKRVGILGLGGALVKWPKYFFLPIAMKLASIIENGMLIIYHQGPKIFFLPEGPRFSQNVSKKSILPVKWGVMLNNQDVKVIQFL